MFQEQNVLLGSFRALSHSTYFLLLLLSELDVVVAFEGDGLVSSVCHPVCLLFPYKAFGAELDRGMELS